MKVQPIRKANTNPMEVTLFPQVYKRDYSALTPMVKQINFELDQSEDALIRQAANLIGLGHSTFCRMQAVKEARRIISELGGSQ